MSPTDNRGACDTEIKNASRVCPDRVRPLASVMVPETISGSCVPVSPKTDSAANSAALQLSVSNTVSIRIRSAPPSISPRTCSL